MKKEVTFGSRLFAKNKRGVSPLIATVLLIAFAVALGAVVMNWGRGYVDDTTQFATTKTSREVRCSMDIGLKFLELGEVKQVCLDNGTNTINFTVVNTGTVNIAGMKAQAVGNSSFVDVDINETISIAGLKKGYISYYLAGNGSLQKVMFTPMILVEGEKMLCARNNLVNEDVGIC